MKTARSDFGEPVTLLEWQESAYGVGLFVEGPTVLVLTPTTAIRLTDGEPLQKFAAPLSDNATLLGDSIVYWHDGAARIVSKSGGEPHSLAQVERTPQKFFAWERRLAWLERAEDGPFSLVTLDAKKPRVLHRTDAYLATATILRDWVYFVERGADGSWRIGGVSARDQRTVFSRPRQGRTPSMLVPTADGLYYYDGPTRSVRRTSPDLEHEVVFAEDVICSPLAVSDRVVCGHVEGVYEIPGKGRSPRVLSHEPRGAIAAVAADEKRAVWIVDTAENRFAVRSLPLPPPP